MISEKMQPLLKNNSAIRMMFEEGKKMAAVYGQRMCMISAWETPAFRRRRRWSRPFRIF